MKICNPDDEKEYKNFLREWKSNYTVLNSQGKCEACNVVCPVKPPSVTSLRILYQYATQGSIPGEFITAVLQNDLYTVFGTAPADEVDRIYGTVQYVTLALLQEAHGSPEKVGNWINKSKRSRSHRPTDLY